MHPVLPGDLKSWDDFAVRSDLFREMVAGGKAAMWQGPDERVAGALETGFAPMPIGPHGYSFSVADTLIAYFISAETPHAEACWQWIKFLSMQPTASQYLPAHMAAAQSPAFADHVGAELAEVYRAAMAGGSDQAYLTGQWVDWLNPGLVWLAAAAERAAKGEAPLIDTLADAEDTFAHYRECVIEGQAFDDRAAWRACAVGVDPDLARRY